MSHIWYIDPMRRELEVCRLIEGKWLQLGVYGGDEKVRAEPFEIVELDLAEWWLKSERHVFHDVEWDSRRDHRSVDRDLSELH